MRRFFPLVICVMILLMLVLVSAVADEGKEEGLKSLPASLDNLFPPKAEGPVFLLRMFGMSAPFTGILVDLMEGDIKNVQADYQAFKAEYESVSKLVPEWTHDFPPEPVEELGAALKTGDQKKIMAAFGKVGKVCHDCHHEYMIKVQQKYHWKDLGAVKVKHPFTQQEMKYTDFMHFLSSSLTGIQHNLQQGQKENAQKQYQGFKAAFAVLRDSCEQCHEDKKRNTERKYYVDQNIQALVDKLGQALNAAQIDPKEIAGLAGQIGHENCFKCHLVHLPAAMAQD